MTQTENYISQVRNLQTTSEVYDLVSLAISQHLPKNVIIIAQLDEKLNSAYVYDLVGLKRTWYNKLISVMGMNPISKRFDLTAEMSSYYYSTKYFRKFSGTLMQFAGGQLPEFVCRAIEVVFSINEIYTIAFHYRNTPMGCVIFFNRHNELPDFGDLPQLLDAASERLYFLINKNKVALNIPSLKDDFTQALLNNISHEIRTPLNGILGLLEVAELYQQSRDANNKDLINGIWLNAKLLMKNVENLILASELETNTATFLFDKRMAVALVEMIDSIVARFEKESQGRVIDLAIESPHTQMIIFDRCKIEYVIEELLTNALKFSEYHLEIIVSFKDDFTFSVKDYGIGMSDKEQDVVLKHFSRVETSDKMFRGIGLGLSNANQIAIRHNGSLTVFSQQSVGTIVTLKLPFASEDDNFLLN